VAGDGARGWADQAPFDRIMLTAAAEDPPTLLLSQLREGGVMVLPVGQSDDVQQLLRIVKTPHGLEYTELMPVRFVPLLEGVPNADG
jgi:protein-L-isoaspartate(D-aspartate) O-methyltransferase